MLRRHYVDPKTTATSSPDGRQAPSRRPSASRRSTLDIDIVAAIDESNIEGLVEALGATSRPTRLSSG